MREWKRMEKESKADPKHVKQSVCNVQCICTLLGLAILAFFDTAS